LPARKHIEPTPRHTADIEVGANPELAKARQTIKQLRSELVAVEEHLTQAEARAKAAEQRFAAAGDLVARLFAEEKRQRILAAAEHWPELPASSIAIVTSASPGHVSEVLKGENGR
jgi:septal ring factor EnvC (AmiA/AmiB activator)